MYFFLGKKISVLALQQNHIVLEPLDLFFSLIKQLHWKAADYASHLFKGCMSSQLDRFSNHYFTLISESQYLAIKSPRTQKACMHITRQTREMTNCHNIYNFICLKVTLTGCCMPLKLHFHLHISMVRIC